MKRYRFVLIGFAFLILAMAVLAMAQQPTREPLGASAQQAAAQTDEFQLACSPPPQCFRDRDCDKICGKGNGTCRRVNSCYNECLCNQTLQVSGI